MEASPVEASADDAPADTDPASDSEPSAHATPTACGPTNDTPRANAAAPTRTPLLTDTTHNTFPGFIYRPLIRMVKIAQSEVEAAPVYL